MISFADQYIIDFCAWLSDRYPADDVGITILHGFDSIDCGDAGGGFAAYNPETRSILCADPKQMKLSFNLTEDEMKENALTNIAHEYRHHMQSVSNEPFSEDDAEEFANRATQVYLENGCDIRLG